MQVELPEGREPTLDEAPVLTGHGRREESGVHTCPCPLIHPSIKLAVAFQANCALKNWNVMVVSASPVETLTRTHLITSICFDSSVHELGAVRILSLAVGRAHIAHVLARLQYKLTTVVVTSIFHFLYFLNIVFTLVCFGSCHILKCILATLSVSAVFFYGGRMKTTMQWHRLDVAYLIPSQFYFPGVVHV